MALRPAHLLPPKRLLTPRSARRLSATNRGLLLGSPAITQTGLAPAGLVQLSGRTIGQAYGRSSLTIGWVSARPAEYHFIGQDLTGMEVSTKMSEA